MSCNVIAKETQLNHYENSTADIFAIFRVSFVLIVFRWCQLLWLLRSGEVVGYNVEIPITGFWMREMY